MRLLNLSHNQLQHVAHLDHLTSLVYLDLSRNQLQAVAGLAALQNLRVLMLGRNAISDLVGIEVRQALFMHSKEALLPAVQRQLQFRSMPSS